MFVPNTLNPMPPPRAVEIVRLPPVVSMARIDPLAKPVPLLVKKVVDVGGLELARAGRVKIERGAVLHGKLAGNGEIGERGRLGCDQDPGRDVGAAVVRVGRGEQERAAAAVARHQAGASAEGGNAQRAAAAAEIVVAAPRAERAAVGGRTAGRRAEESAPSARFSLSVPLSRAIVAVEFDAMAALPPPLIQPATGAAVLRIVVATRAPLGPIVIDPVPGTASSR